MCLIVLSGMIRAALLGTTAAVLKVRYGVNEIISTVMMLTGGSGADEFRFDLTAETSTGWFDTITDFTDGVDILHYTGITASTTIEVFDAGSLLGSRDGTLVRADSIHWAYLERFDDTLIDTSDFLFT